MTFREAADNERRWKKTWNGADAYNTSSSACLDLFGRAGSMRSASLSDKLDTFDAAYKEDKDIAVKLLFYTRDIRGGYGERDTFNQMLAHLASVNKESVVKNLWAVLEFGRAKDLYSLIGTPAENDMWQFMKSQFEMDLENMQANKSVSLLAKWIATPDSKSDKTKALGILTAKKLGYSFKTMREYKNNLRALRRYLEIPEAKMATGRWSEIEYSKCASKFLLKYREAFKRHDAVRYEKYLEDVKNGAQKMNMGTTVPCDIIQKVYSGNYTPDLEVMWQNLPDMNSGNALVIADTSGSMFDRYWTKNKGPLPGVVAYALAIYFAERNKGCLKDLFITFSDRPHFVELKGATLKQKFDTLYTTNDWDSSTNLEAAFDLVLKTAINNKLAPEDMPESLVVISDMQVNCVNGISDSRVVFFDAMKQKYEAHGYKLPHVVFWNVNAVNSTFLAAKSDAGVSLVSGYSPNIFEQVLKCIGTTPYELMLEVINSERYKDVKA